MTTDEIMAMVREAQRQTMNGESITTFNLADYGLGNVDCPTCQNKGYLTEKFEDGTIISRPCSCMAKRRSLRRISKSGLGDALSRYTFEAWEPLGEKRKAILAKALEFSGKDSGWFYITGRSGSGKSHICTAICGALIDREQDVYYMPWRDEATAIKANIRDGEWYEKKLRSLKTVPVLYIDDFLKGGDTDADLRLAFEIINGRYIDSKLRTVISSETELKDLLSRDEALGGRIYERSKGFVLKTPDENWRLR